MTPPMSDGRRALRETAIVYLAITASTFAVTRLRDLEALGDYVHLVVAAIFLLTAMRLAQREEDGMRRYGIDLSGLLHSSFDDGGRPGPFGLFDLARTARRAAPTGLRELGVALAVVGVVFPPFAIGFWVFWQPSGAFEPSLPEDFASFALAQVLVVALPEEALFRGYFQTRLTDVWPSTRRLLGADVSPKALIAQAAYFGVLHFVVDLDPQRLAVFFPALLFGWLRAHRGGIGAAIAVHALSNVYSDLLVRGWLS